VKYSQVVFLDVNDVQRMHVRAIEVFGGSHGIRDHGLLESAVMAPRATYGGTVLHPTLATMAAALGYGLAKNHPFVDGNKRVAAMATLAMLRLNGFRLRIPQKQGAEVFIRVAEDAAFRRDALAAFLVEIMGTDVAVEADDE
jgi:death-on-curing protein